MKIGFFGGSFDPVHLGHLLLAESCLEQGQLDQIWFVPTATAPHKQHQTPTDLSHRLAMTELAIGGHPGFALSTLEADRGGISYTVDSLAEIDRRQPDDQLFLLMGADSLADFSTWKSPPKICSLALPLVVRRAGLPEPDLHSFKPFVSAERLAEIKTHQIEFPAVDVSSTAIRQRVENGNSIRFLVPRAVEKYIQHNGLYQGTSLDA